MHPDEQAIRQTILESPSDDVARLVYADWLQEHDQSERADLLRTQIALECWWTERELSPNTLPGPPEWVLRERKLLNKFANEWTKHLRTPRLIRKNDQAKFRRGCIEAVALEVAGAARCLAELRQIEPIQEMSLSTLRAPDALLDVFASPDLSALRTLDLRCLPLAVSGGFHGRSLFGATHLESLRELRLGHNGIPDAILGLLLGSSWLNQLRSVSLSDCRIDSFWMRNIAESPHVRGLRSLDLSFNLIGASGVESIARSPHLRQLRELRMSYNPLEDESIPLLVRGQWEHLVRLEMGRSRLTIDGMRWLADGSRFPSLRWLNISGNTLNDDGLFALMDGSMFGQLHGLDLSYGNLSAQAMIELVESPSVANLFNLDLSYNAMTPAVVDALVRSPHLSRLQNIGCVPMRGAAQAALHRRFGTGVRV